MSIAASIPSRPTRTGRQHVAGEPHGPSSRTASTFSAGSGRAGRGSRVPLEDEEVDFPRPTACTARSIARSPAGRALLDELEHEILRTGVSPAPREAAQHGAGRRASVSARHSGRPSQASVCGSGGMHAGSPPCVATHHLRTAGRRSALDRRWHGKLVCPVCRRATQRQTSLPSTRAQESELCNRP